MNKDIMIRDRLPFERQRYWQGQMLRSRDFNDQLALQDEMRWWHNRAVHEAFGIVHGLKVEEQKNEAGELVVRIFPGLAYDCYGREICLHKATTKKVPDAIPGGWTLLVRRPRERIREGSSCCISSPAPPEPVLEWKPSHKATLHDGVPLAAVDKPGSIRPVRRAARPEVRPLIGHGETVPGQTAWQPWIANLRRGGGLVAVYVTVDTSSVGFTDTPSYFAWLGQPALPDSAPVFGGITRSGRDSFVYVALLHGRPTHTGTVGVRTRRAVAPVRTEPNVNFAIRHLYICWLGIECAKPCSRTDEVTHGRPY